MYLAVHVGLDGQRQVLLASAHQDTYDRVHTPACVWSAADWLQIYGPTLEAPLQPGVQAHGQNPKVTPEERPAGAGCWIGMRNDGKYGALCALPETPRPEMDCLLLLLPKYLTRGCEPLEFVEDTIKLEALVTKAPFSLVLGSPTATFLIHVQNGAVQHCHNLGSGSYSIRRMDGDAAVVSELDHIACRWMEGASRDDTVTDIFKGLSAHVDKHRAEPFAQRALYLAVMLTGSDEVSVAEKFFDLSRFQWDHTHEALTVVGHDRAPSCPQVAWPGWPDLVVLPPTKKRKAQWDPENPLMLATADHAEVVDVDGGGGRASGKARQRSAPKDPNRPKGYISAFNYFAKEKRDAIMKADKTLKNNEVNKRIGKAWKELSESEREAYEERAREDKLRYLKEMEAYHPSQGFFKEAPRINRPAVPADVDDASDKPDERIQRPRTAYCHFVKQERKRLAVATEHSWIAEMSKRFGFRWQTMTTKERELYEKLAEADRLKYARLVGGSVLTNM